MKLSIIIPYRNREENMKKFILRWKHFMEKSVNKNISYDIWFIEQKDTEPYRFGKSVNIGFLETEKISNYIFTTGVDFVPKDRAYKNLDLSLSKDKVKPLFGMTMHCLVGILIGNRSYRTLNGYANNYKGHGYEDYDFTEYRIRAGEVEVDWSCYEKLKQKRQKTRDRAVMGPNWHSTNITHLPHKKNIEVIPGWEGARRGSYNRAMKDKQKRIRKIDGVNNCVYEVLDRIKLEDNVYHLEVDFLHKEQDKLTYNV